MRSNINHGWSNIDHEWSNIDHAKSNIDHGWSNIDCIWSNFDYVVAHVYAERVVDKSYLKFPLHAWIRYKVEFWSFYVVFFIIFALCNT